MIKGILAFVMLSIFIYGCSKLWALLSVDEKLDLTEAVFYIIVCLSVAALIVAGIIFLF